MLEDEDHFIDVLKSELRKCEFEVMFSLFFKDLNRSEIARKLGISRKRVSQLRQSAIHKLRHPLRLQRLIDA